MKKAIATLLAVFCLLGSMTALAAEPITEEYGSTTAGTISPLAEETEWAFRVNNGVVQMRLWSYTRGIWLTDWIDCPTTIN